MIVHTFTDGDYTAKVYENAMVDVFHGEELIDNPGPWGDVESAAQWAQLIVAKYAAEGHTT